MYTIAERKEIEYIYKRHNTKWKGFELDVEQSKIVFPKNVSKIINKEKPLTDREKEIRKKFRQNVWRDLGIQSVIKQSAYFEEINAKKEKVAQKRKAAIEERNALDINKIKHFGVWKDKRKILKINRDTYAIIDNKFHGEKREKEFYRKKYSEYPDIYGKIFTDDSCTYFTDDWCNNHREKCLLNFDLNMRFMENLSKDKFERQINKLAKKSKKIKEIYDLNEMEGVSGVYVLILDEYKQMYIGQSDDIKRRIQEHWSKNKEFNRLIFGKVETSVLSIDSFGALDTTRIFVYPARDKYSVEKELVDFIDKSFLLNRTGGGILIESEFEKLEVIANMNSRNLKQG